MVTASLINGFPSYPQFVGLGQTPYCDLVGAEAGVLLYFQNIQSIQKVYIILVTMTKVTRIKIRLTFTKTKLPMLGDGSASQCVKVLMIPGFTT